VLKEPEATVRMNTLADSSINFIVRPWALTADYWDVYWDVTRAVKQRFDEANIGIPYPQRDVHLYIQDGGASLSSNKAASAQERGAAVREDGRLDSEDQG